MRESCEIPRRTPPAASSAATIRASVLSLILDGLDRRGIPVHDLAAGAFPGAARIADPYAELDLRQYVATFEQAATLAREPFFGLRLAEEIGLEQFGPIAILILAARTLGDVLRTWSRYARIWQSGTAVELTVNDDFAECLYQISDPTIWPRRQDNEFTLALTCRLFRASVGPQWAPLEVQFEHPAPEDVDVASARRLYHRAFRCPVEFGASANRILVDRADLLTPAVAAYRSLAPFVEPLLRTLEPSEAAGELLSERVAQLVRSRMGESEVRLPELAAALRLSSRSLQRRLQAEGSSLRTIVQDCRRQRAEAMLTDPSRQVTAVALGLGYSDTSVLSRAFKQWTGISPRSYRKGRGDD